MCGEKKTWFLFNSGPRRLDRLGEPSLAASRACMPLGRGEEAGSAPWESRVSRSGVVSYSSGSQRWKVRIRLAYSLSYCSSVTCTKR